jgi:hypothetical protein
MVLRMLRRLLFAALLYLALPLGAFAQTEGQRASAVVELYTSQGCIQCPRANRLLGQFTREDDVLALTFPVGIWDYLGWADTLARPEFTRRQRAYSESLRELRRTPQLIMNGAHQIPTSSWDDARALLDTERARGLSGLAISMVRQRYGRVDIAIGAGAAPAAPADVWFVEYERDTITVLVTRGMNSNRSVPHYNLVNRIDHIGAWNGSPISFQRTRCRPSCAVLVQSANTGPILSAAFIERR